MKGELIQLKMPDPSFPYEHGYAVKIIKLIRVICGCGLKEAKFAYDDMRAGEGVTMEVCQENITNELFDLRQLGVTRVPGASEVRDNQTINQIKEHLTIAIKLAIDDEECIQEAKILLDALDIIVDMNRESGE